MTRVAPLLTLALILSICAASLGADTTAADPPRVPLNLALGKPATASGAQGGHAPSHAVDGDDGTRWCAPDNNAGYWLQIDLEQPEDLTGLRVAWEFDRARYRHTIESSADGNTWSTLVDRRSDAAPLAQREEVQKVNAKGVRYLRVTATGVEKGRWASLSEVEVFGNKTTDASAVTKRKNAGLLKEIKAPAGLNLTLFAAPPDVSYPVCVAAAVNGDVFVATDANGSLDQKTGRGKIICCRDTNDDGEADAFKTFAELDSPRGMVWDGSTNTMYVQHPPFVSAFHDDDNDGKADRNEVLVEGLGFDLNFRGADHTTNGMQIGVDGFLYIAVGDYGFIKATGRDGKSLQLYGGGVVRVRTDGTQLEIVSRGQRNIYDVAVSPTLDLFTRDNTNDGDGWEVRLSHVVQGGQYGYPSLYKHFAEETLAPLGIFGGGSPTGSVYLDEPGLPGGLGRTLYTCDWGRNIVYRHPLEPSGASYKAGQEVFVEMPRPIDMEVDGASRLYLASWRNGGFSYTGPDVGYVVRLVDPNYTPAPAFDFKKAGDVELVQQFGGDSHVRRLAAQRELLHRHRGKPRNPAVWDALVEHMTGAHPLAGQVAALFTFVGIENTAEARAVVERLAAAQRPIREHALRALADDVQHAGDTSADLVADALRDPSPRIRFQAVSALGRLGKADAAAHILPLVADADPVVAHAAIHTLVLLKSVAPALRALDVNKAALISGAIQVLQAQHDPRVVEGLVVRLSKTRDPSLRRPILKALCRLYTRQADWTGGWWGTRPDTSGPYFQAVPWEQSGYILDVLRKALAEADADILPFLLTELQRHKIDLPEATPRLLELAGKDKAFQAAAADLLATRPALPPEAIPLLAETAGSTRHDPTLRARSLAALYRTGQPDALAAAVNVLAKLDAQAPAELVAARADFLRDARHASHVATFTQLAASEDAARRELAFGVLLQIATAKKSPKESAEAAFKALDAGFAEAGQAPSLLRAIGRDKVEAYAAKAAARRSDADPAVRDAAEYAVTRLGPNAASPVEAAKTLISETPYRRTLAVALKEKGDVKIGAELFLKQGCVACHAVSKNEPPKGPFLGGIAQRYSRAELVESILKPNAKIAQGFSTHYFITKKRVRVDGFIVREGGDEVEVRDATGVSTVLKNTDVSRKGTLATSIMPEALVDALSPHELASLLAYLESLKAE